MSVRRRNPWELQLRASPSVVICQEMCSLQIGPMLMSILPATAKKGTSWVWGRKFGTKNRDHWTAGHQEHAGAVQYTELLNKKQEICSYGGQNCTVRLLYFLEADAADSLVLGTHTHWTTRMARNSSFGKIVPSLRSTCL